MTSILRSPVISSETRKLTARRASAADATAPVPAVAATSAAASAPPAAPPLVPLTPVPDVEALLAKARESVLAQFKQEAETARELGRQRGMLEGRAAGAEEARREAGAELTRIRAIAGKLQGVLDEGVRGMEDVAVQIAFEAVCRLLGSSAATSDGVRALVREAAAQVGAAERIAVRLHPADLAALQAAGTLDTALPHGANVAWMGDASLALGGCVVETDGGTLDARLETQMERLRATLLAARAGSSA